MRRRQHLEIRPAGVGDEDLVARLHDGSEDNCDALHASVGDQDLFRRDVQTVDSLQARGCGLAQVAPSRRLGVARPAAGGVDGGFDDVRGSGEIWLPDLEVENITPSDGEVEDLADARRRNPAGRRADRRGQAHVGGHGKATR